MNFRIDPQIIQSQLPQHFRPKLHDGSAIAGICLIRLEQMRPKLFPAILGVSSENAAHRVAVLWKGDKGQLEEGVFIPRRDTNSLFNVMAGGRVFPGEHHRADFQVKTSGNQIEFEMNSNDGETAVHLRARVVDSLPASSRFSCLEEASHFFEPGSLGYSVTRDNNRLDGLRLHTRNWKVEPLDVERVYSSYFADKKKFPKGSVTFDCALVMRNIEHEWQSAPDLYV